ncbi:MAG: hypothetical protein IJP31_12010 [Lachnospiraceae bacterium]|nr:hypothetical protein [Lachnospiraceae bacterium]
MGVNKGRGQKKGTTALIILFLIACILSGCIALPGQEPFGERTYSDEEARLVYEKITESMVRLDFTQWEGYSIRCNGTIGAGYSDCIVVETEEYRVAYLDADKGEYLWYEGWLYYTLDDQITYCDMAWEELQAREFVTEGWEIGQHLLNSEPKKLRYKYVPMASGNIFSAEYENADWKGRELQFPQLSLSPDSNADYDGLSIGWQEGDLVPPPYTGISFFPYEGTTSLQAERRIWFLGEDFGLTDEVVPALSTQEENRQWCRQIIESMDFSRLREMGTYDSELEIPLPW